jgi:FkbM family methyltransferase
MSSHRRFVSRLCAHTFISSVLGPESVVVDLGLNQGQFAKGISERFGCRVYGVEPVPSLFEAIKNQPNLTAENYAIAAQAGSGTINVFEGRCASMGPAFAGESARAIAIETTTLEDFLGRHHLRQIDLLKVDIEGAELEMIEHLSPAILAGIRQITIEFHDFLHPETGSAVQNAIQTLQRAGFYPIRFSQDNIDLLFLNSRSFPNARLLRFLLHYWHRPWMAISRKIRRRFGNENSDHF